MLTRHSFYGRLLIRAHPIRALAGMGAVAFCALTAGWIAGQHAPFFRSVPRGSQGSSEECRCCPLPRPAANRPGA